MRRDNKEAEDRIAAMPYLRMRQARDHGEVVSQLLKPFQVGRWLVVFAGFLGKEIRGMQAERCADADHAPRRAVIRGMRWSKCIKPRQGKRDAGGTQKMTPIDRCESSARSMALAGHGDHLSRVRNVWL